MYLHVHVSDNTRGTWFEYMSDWAKFTENPANNAHLVVYEDLKQVNILRNLPILYSFLDRLIETFTTSLT